MCACGWASLGPKGNAPPLQRPRPTSQPPCQTLDAQIALAPTNPTPLSSLQDHRARQDSVPYCTVMYCTLIHICDTSLAARVFMKRLPAETIGQVLSAIGQQARCPWEITQQGSELFCNQKLNDHFDNTLTKKSVTPNTVLHCMLYHCHSRMCLRQLHREQPAQTCCI